MDSETFIQNRLSNELEHHGVKGMKWGIRKNRSTGAVKARATMTRRDRRNAELMPRVSNVDPTYQNPNKKLTRNQKWAANTATVGYDKVFKKAKRKIRTGIKQINNDPKYKGQDFKMASPLRNKYYNDISKLVTNQMNAASVLKGTSPNKHYRLDFTFNAATDSFPTGKIVTVGTRVDRKAEKAAAKEVRNLKHGDKEIESNDVELKFDSLGHLIDIILPVESSDEFIHRYLEDDSLEHHGVKGMRWGHRKTPVRSSRQTSSSTNKSSNRSSKKTPSKKSKIKSMSDSEIQSRIKRLEMEKRLSTLSSEDRHPGTNFVKNALKDSGKQVLTTVGKNAMLGGLRYATDKSFTGKDFAKSLVSTGGSSKKKGVDK